MRIHLVQQNFVTNPECATRARSSSPRRAVALGLRSIIAATLHSGGIPALRKSSHGTLKIFVFVLEHLGISSSLGLS